jgi:hypothetical protein
MMQLERVEQQDDISRRQLRKGRLSPHVTAHYLHNRLFQSREPMSFNNVYHRLPSQIGTRF